MTKLNEHLEIKPMQEARVYAELRQANPHLPDPDFVAHGVKIEVGEVSLVTLHVYVNIPDSWMVPVTPTIEHTVGPITEVSPSE